MRAFLFSLVIMKVEEPIPNFFLSKEKNDTNKKLTPVFLLNN